MSNPFNLEKICSLFNLNGEFIEYKRNTNGHINSTFILTFNEDGNLKKYVLQKISTEIFIKISTTAIPHGYQNPLMLKSFLKNGSSPYPQMRSPQIQRADVNYILQPNLFHSNKSTSTWGQTFRESFNTVYAAAKFKKNFIKEIK